MSNDDKNLLHAFGRALALIVAACCVVAIVGVMRDPSAQDAAPDAAQPPVLDAVQAKDGEAGSRGDSSGVDADANETVASKAADAEAPQPYEYVDEVDSDEANDDAGMEAPGDDERLTIPQGANYVPDEVLVTVRPDATVEEVNALLAQTDSVVSREVSAEEIASGCIRLEVAEGASVEDAMNDLDDSELTEGAQPNFIYYAMLGDERDLRVRLAARTMPQPVPQAAAGEDAESSDATDGEVTAAEEAANADDGAATQTQEDAVQEDGGEVAESGEPTGSGEGVPSEEEASSGAEDQQLEPEDASEDGTIEAQGSDEATTQDEEQLDLHALAEELKPNDEHLNEQWALASMHVYEAWALVRCEHTVGVAVIDQGQDPTHEDLADNVVDTYDAVTKSESISFTNDHGTAVSGIVSAIANNEIGVAGVSYNANLILVNVGTLGADGVGITTTSLLEAYAYVIAHAGEHSIRVINLSIGGPTKVPIDQMSDKALENAINRAYEKGIVTVASAGNAGGSYADGTTATAPFYEYPGDYEKVVSVINLRKSGSSVAKAGNSNYNAYGQIDKNISAPGTDILSTYSDPSNPSVPYDTSLSGTSMASPQVAGVLALEFAANPELSADEAVRILYGTAYESATASGGIYRTDKTTEENYTNFGWGEVNAFEAVKSARGDEPVAELPDINSLVIPFPTVKGATRIPVGATADYTVTDGSIKIKSGGDYASLSGSTLTGEKAGKVTLAVLDKNGKERTTRTVTVYATSGTWVIASKLNTNYVIDVNGASVENKGNAIIYASKGKNNQVWLLERQSDGAFVIRSGLSGKVLDVANGSKASGANVCQFTLGAKDWQRWTIQVAADNSIVFYNKNSGMALEADCATAANSKNVRQATYTSDARQRWVLKSVTADIGDVWDGVYRISSSINRNYVIEVYRASTANSANVELYRWNGGNHQKWRIQYLGNDVYKIYNINSSRCLDVAYGKLANLVNIEQYTWKNGSNQRWNLTKYADGSYAIVRAGTSWVLDAKGAKAQNRTNVQQYRRKNNNAQKWFFTQF